MLSGKCVALGVSGGIAAYKAAELVSRLKKRGARVRVVMTKNACRFVAPLTFETLSGGPVYVDGFEHAYDIEHISIAKEADLLLIAPATANIIGKIACGIADDLLSTIAMAASKKPLLIAPAMNTAMYTSPGTTENIARLKARGARFIGPESGVLACGDTDIGRMSEPRDIEAAVLALFASQNDLSGRRILVTAGPTREMIDPVRYLTNRSSGKMGYEIAKAAQRRGATVTLISGPVALPAPFGVELISIVSSEELYEAVTLRADHFDAVIQAAAPADFTPQTYADQKIKKTGDALRLDLVATKDIARTLGERKRNGQVLVAFAAETRDLIENARGKRLRKNADLVVANDVTETGAGFAVDTNRVTLVGELGEETLPLLSKAEVADRILDRVLAIWETTA